VREQTLAQSQAGFSNLYAALRSFQLATQASNCSLVKSEGWPWAKEVACSRLM